MLIVCAGPFISVLLSRIENMLSNSLHVNLLLTGILAQLAAYPQPLLRSFLLNTNLVLQPSVRSLYQVNVLSFLPPTSGISVNTTDVNPSVSFLNFIPGTRHCEAPDWRAGCYQKRLSWTHHCCPTLAVGQGDFYSSRYSNDCKPLGGHRPSPRLTRSQCNDIVFTRSRILCKPYNIDHCSDPDQT